MDGMGLTGFDQVCDGNQTGFPGRLVHLAVVRRRDIPLSALRMR